MSNLRLAATAAVLTLAAPAGAQTFDLVGQGPNPANFEYGYDSGAGFTVFDFATQYQTSGCAIGGTSCYAGPASFLGVYFAPSDGSYQTATLRANEATFHPGPNGELIGVRFVAPTAGSYRFTGTFRAADSPNGNGVTYSTPLGTGVLGLQPATFAFDFTQSLAAGGTALFTVGNNGAYAFDTTGLTLSVSAVPEPATWGLMILGFGAVGGAMRRRRAATTTVRLA